MKWVPIELADKTLTLTEEDDENARAILRWMLDPTYPPFTDELQQAACRCANLIVEIFRQQQEQAKSATTE